MNWNFDKNWLIKMDLDHFRRYTEGICCMLSFFTWFYFIFHLFNLFVSFLLCLCFLPYDVDSFCSCFLGYLRVSSEETSGLEKKHNSAFHCSFVFSLLFKVLLMSVIMFVTDFCCYSFVTLIISLVSLVFWFAVCVLFVSGWLALVVEILTSAVKSLFMSWCFL